MGSFNISFLSSFEAHKEEDRKKIINLFEEDLNGYYQYSRVMAESDLNAEAKDALKLLLNSPLLDTEGLAKQRAALPILLNYYETELAKINPESFIFLTAAKKKRLKNQLIYTYSLIYAQYQLNWAEKRRYKFEEHIANLDLCLLRLGELESTLELDTVGSAIAHAVPEKPNGILAEDVIETPAEKSKEELFQKAHQAELSLANRCLEFIGLTLISSWFIKQYQQFINNYTGTFVEWMTEINFRRLYWVWGGSMLDAIFEMLPKDFFNAGGAQANLAIPAPATGYMSWVLYYTRFGINLALLVKHTFFAEGEEANIPIWERFTTQWQQRKFKLLNDLIWGFANMLCFFWLCGKGWLGYAGNVLTLLLLIMDLGLNTWSFLEEQTKHNANMAAIERDREQLTQRISELKTRVSEELDPKLKGQLLAEIGDLEAELENLNQLERQANFEWKYKQYGLMNDWLYALGLVIAFTVMVSLLFPPAILVPLAALITTIIGATLSFICTVVSTAIGGYLQYAKAQELSELGMAARNELMEKFRKEGDPNVKKLLYLEIKKEEAQSEYQLRVAHFQIAKLIRSTLIDTMIPALVFFSLIFVPLGTGLAILGAGFALVIFTYMLMNRFEPQGEQLPEFNEQEYVIFLNSQEEIKNEPGAQPVFFPADNPSAKKP